MDKIYFPKHGIIDLPSKKQVIEQREKNKKRSSVHLSKAEYTEFDFRNESDLTNNQIDKKGKYQFIQIFQ